jgi:crotonobetainyl-CoA:carnitine CoA-transferase CaiB-like acyl-CoA transferase
MTDNNAKPRSTSRPLDGIRVLDLTSALAGPYATLMLGGLGAEVISVEAPGGRDMSRESPPYIGPNGLNFSKRRDDEVSIAILNRKRNKKSVTLDLKSRAGRDLFLRLASNADVIVENMSEGTPTRLGIDYASVRERNAEIIYASIRAFGEPSCYPDVKGVDIIIQALSGVMAVTGFPDGPPTRFGLPIGDMLAPGYAVNGVLAAIIHRSRTGEGQHIVVSMLDCLASLLAIENFDMLVGKAGYPMRSGNSMDRMAPFGVYETRNGYVAIAAGRDNWFPWLLDAIGQPELLQDPRFANRADRTKHAKAINDIVEAWTRSLTTAEVIQKMQVEHRVPAVPVRNPMEVLSDPTLRASGAVVELSHPSYGEVGAVGAGLPIQFSKTSVQYDQPAQDLGASNQEVFGNLLGLTAEEIGRLRREGVI